MSKLFDGNLGDYRCARCKVVCVAGSTLACANAPCPMELIVAGAPDPLAAAKQAVIKTTIDRLERGISAELDWLEEARTWAHFLALLAKDGGGHLTRTTCVRLAQMLNEAEPPKRTQPT